MKTNSPAGFFGSGSADSPPSLIPFLRPWVPPILRQVSASGFLLSFARILRFHSKVSPTFGDQTQNKMVELTRFAGSSPQTLAQENMKITLTILVWVAISTFSYGFFENFAKTPEEKIELHNKSQAVFIGHAEILNMRYLGENGRVITPEEVAASKPFLLDPLYYTTDSPIRRIEFTLRLVSEKFLKGEKPEEGDYTISYSNSLIVTFTNEPRDLHKGGKMTFYILKSEKNRILEIGYGDPPQ
jgi:hypothetical protein